jgi:hypothetical protein
MNAREFIDEADYASFVENTAESKTIRFIMYNILPILIFITYAITIYIGYIYFNFKPLLVLTAFIGMYYIFWEGILMENPFTWEKPRARASTRTIEQLWNWVNSTFNRILNTTIKIFKTG